MLGQFYPSSIQVSIFLHNITVKIIFEFAQRQKHTTQLYQRSKDNMRIPLSSFILIRYVNIERSL
jgi:hypothetical protein